jgi:hypothetical protein
MTDAERAHELLDLARSDERVAAAQAYATLALADSIHRATQVIAGALVEAARIRAGKR